MRTIGERPDGKDVVTRLSTVSEAPDRARFAIIASGPEQRRTDPDETPDTDDREKLFLAPA
ncbi:cytoplasmic protein [Kocuria kalidii]|uniref:cytoplasmic protein n=1 Tax=Kocuria kalidii TaxID=3376283 RepID=UPI0037A63E0C